MNSPPSTEFPRRRLRVLVVEDDYSVRGLYLQMLQRAGYEVAAASTALGAMDLLRTEEPFDVVLLDLELHGVLSGLDVWSHVPRDVPVVVVSGYHERSAREQADREHRVRMGRARFICKPATEAVLLSELEAAAAGKDRKDEP